MQYRLASLLLGATFAAPAAAYVSDYQVGFGPHIGTGSISSGADVRHTSGYSLSLQRHWPAGRGFAVGPRFEVTNTFFSTRDTEQDVTSIATYDNRFVAAGLTVAHAVGTDRTFAQGAYLNAVVGRGYSKLAVDETTDRTYTQNLFGNIDGNYAAGEIGAWVPLKGDFGLSLALLGSLYQANQAAATGTFKGDAVNADGTLALVEGEHDTGTLDRRVVMRTVAAKIGLALGF